MISVVVFSPSGVLRAGLESVLEEGDDVLVSGTAGTSDELRDLLNVETPDVVLAEVAAGTGTELREILRQLPAAIILTDDRDGSAVQDAFELGSRGVLAHDAEPREILAAVEAVSAGLVVLDPARSLAFTGSVASDRRERSTGVETLTPREIEVLAMLAEGIGNKMIARRLGISEHTVKFHVGSILSKLEAESRTEAVAMGIRQGLITV